LVLNSFPNESLFLGANPILPFFSKNRNIKIRIFLTFMILCPFSLFHFFLTLVPQASLSI